MKRAPIGVFDSGVGGLSILRALRTELPWEDFVYVADSGHAPYGERDAAHALARSRVIAAHLRAAYDIKALVMACNTATAAAIDALRQEQPDLPIVGVEPALKPALAQSRTGRIGVMATRSTLASAKFRALLASLAGQAEFVCQACDGLADAIEQEATEKIAAFCNSYANAMGQFGAHPGEIDTLVLGCTHYPFAAESIRRLVGPSVHLVDNGEAVARQTRRLLQALANGATPGQVVLLSTGERSALQRAAQRWLALDGRVEPLLL